jgi:hypothetical protein
MDEQVRMYEQPRTLVFLLVAAGVGLHVAIQRFVDFDWRAPRVATLVIAVIGLRWGSVVGAYVGAAVGLILACFSGEPPFGATVAMAAVGLLAGEAPEHFVIESRRAVSVALLLAAEAELLVVCVLRGILPPGGLNVLIWTAGWAVVLGPLIYWLAKRLSTPPAVPRLPAEPE